MRAVMFNENYNKFIECETYKVEYVMDEDSSSKGVRQYTLISNPKLKSNISISIVGFKLNQVEYYEFNSNKSECTVYLDSGRSVNAIVNSKDLPFPECIDYSLKDK